MKTDKKTANDRIFPEYENDLFEKMTAYMPRCYFPTALGEDDIREFARKEFRRVKGIICREYELDGDAGVFPFEFIRYYFEQEVHRRIRKDYMQLNVISARKSLTDTIRRTVEKEGNIIGTFYQNRGTHYRDGKFPEYDTSPVVVFRNPDLFS